MTITPSVQELPYIVDERVGCIAVRHVGRIDYDETNLGPSSSGVVWWKRAVEHPPNKCSECGHETALWWEMPAATRAEARAKCDELNGFDKEPTHD